VDSQLKGKEIIIAQDRSDQTKRKMTKKRKKLTIVGMILSVSVICLLSIAVWLGYKASIIKDELQSVVAMVPTLKANLAANEHDEAAETTARMREGTRAARSAASDPFWVMASSVPWLGANFSAVGEMARTSDDVIGLGLEPIVNSIGTLDWDALLPSTAGANLGPLEAAAPAVTNAAYAVKASAERLETIDATRLLPQVAEPLTASRTELRSVTGALDASADAAQLLPNMLGAEKPRHYLLMIQNNAEARASGGIPGALAIVTLDQGKLTLGAQSSAGEIGTMEPILPVDPEQRHIYSTRLGKFMQDVNLTPDFPTAASTAQAMWERKTGQTVDGVISIDPVVLGYILDATGPVQVSNPDLVKLAGANLPTELDGKNVVPTLLSNVYAQIQEPQLQDAYFAGIAQEVFQALSNGKGDSKALIAGLSRGSTEGRVLLWSALPAEQKTIADYPLSGAIAGVSVSPAQFGVYFNDGTGAKMDYYVKRTVRLVKECPKDGYEQTTVQVTSTNTAPADAASSLPEYVTGNGIYGVPPGSVQTNIVVYGPVQANVETARLDGQQTGFAPYLHRNRPVGVLAVQLAPGESKTVEITFGKIPQHAEPNVIVTPTVQPINDVTLPSENAVCD
jgi:HAMP domain-containing protein